MARALPQWLQAPVFPEDEERTRTARILHTLLVCRVAIVLGLFVAVALPFLFENRLASGLIAGAELGVEGTAWWLNQRARVRAGSLVLVIGSWFILTFLLATSGGIQSINHVYYLALVVMAGLLLGSRWAYGTALACFLAEAALLGVHLAGLSLPRIYPVPPAAILVNITGNLVLVTVVLSIAVKSLGDAVVRARRELAERQRLEAERERIQAELAQGQKLESIGRLAGTVAHDFNNLLHAMGSHIAIARADLPGGSTVAQDLAELDRITQSATELTRSLLVFSRKQVLELNAVDLNALVVGNRRLLEGLLGAGNTLRLSLGAEPWPVRADPTQLQRVLVNLAVNARDAMPHGGTLEISTANVVLGAAEVGQTPDVHPGDHVCLRVRDTGVGMTEEVRSHLFEPFFTTKPKGRGTGLGLSTVFGVVRQHRGLIEVASEPGAGTTFVVHLPRAAGAAPVAALPAPEAPGSASGKEHILLVEDEAPILESTARFLARLGYTVVPAADFDDAVRHARGAAHLDLLVTDVRLGGTGGRAVADAVAGLRPALPVLFVSGCTEADLLSAGVDPQAPNFLAKPYAMAELGVKIRAVLDGKRIP